MFSANMEHFGCRIALNFERTSSSLGICNIGSIKKEKYSGKNREGQEIDLGEAASVNLLEKITDWENKLRCIECHSLYLVNVQELKSAER